MIDTSLGAVAGDDSTLDSSTCRGGSQDFYCNVSPMQDLDTARLDFTKSKLNITQNSPEKDYESNAPITKTTRRNSQYVVLIEM